MDIRVLAYFIFALVFLSCGAGLQQPNRIKKKLSAKEILERHGSIEKNQVDAWRVSSSFSYKDKKGSKSASAVWGFIPDEQLHLSVSYLGFSVAKASFESDSIFAYEKLNKTFIRSDYAPINKLLGTSFLDLSALQNMLMGRLFIPVTEMSNMKLDYTKSRYIIQFERITPDSGQVFSSNIQRFDKGVIEFDSQFRITDLRLFQNETLQVSFNYADWQEKDGLLLPGHVEIESPAQSVNAKIKFRKPVIWDEGKFNFKIPDNYKPNSSFGN